MMTFTEVKQSVSDFLDIELTPFKKRDLNNRQYLGDLHKITSDFMYHLRINNHIKDHQINVRYIDPGNHGLGYNIFIKFWLYDFDPTYQFKYVFDQTHYRLFTAYDRAMKII